MDQQAAHAVNQAREQVQQQSGLAAPVNTAAQTIDTINQFVPTMIETAKDVSSLLDKIAKFNEIVKTIAEVGGFMKLSVLH